MADPISAALRRTHEWFELNSGWAPPDEATLADWLGDGVCRCPDECLVEPDGVCVHGLASWKLVLDDLAVEDARTSRRSALDGDSKALGCEGGFEPR